MSKTVFILGAGFSAEAGAPAQAKLIQKALDQGSSAYDPEMESHTKILKDFLLNSLNLDRDQLSKVPLEDVFTPLDKCAVENLSFRSLSASQVVEVRNTVSLLIGKVLNHELYDYNSKRYIDLFAEKIVEQSETRSGHRYRELDPVSVISTNWDILLDNSLHKIIQRKNMEGPCGIVDYCCHVSSLDKHDESVKPGLEVMGGGGYAVKLLKLHGSLNWLQCSRCLRLYAKFYVKVGVDNGSYGRVRCRHCQNNFGDANKEAMIPNVVMPTFLKDLRNPQLKIIWQNAGNELSEASRLVIIGYSLPFADYELRQLFARMTRTNAEIWVVGFSKIADNARADLRMKYKVFFGKRRIRFFWKGAAHFVQNNLDHALTHNEPLPEN